MIAIDSLMGYNDEQFIGGILYQEGWGIIPDSEIEYIYKSNNELDVLHFLGYSDEIFISIILFNNNINYFQEDEDHRNRTFTFEEAIHKKNIREKFENQYPDRVEYDIDEIDYFDYELQRAIEERFLEISSLQHIERQSGGEYSDGDGWGGYVPEDR